MGRHVFIVAAALTAGCGCRAAASSETAGSVGATDDDTEFEDTEFEDTEPVPDLPPWEECEDSVGTQLVRGQEDWNLQAEEEVLYGLAALTGTHGFLEGRLDGGNEVVLSQVNLANGEVLSSSVVGVKGSGGRYYLHPSGDLLRLEADRHRIHVQRFDGTDLIDEVELVDDHPKVGWNGGSSSVGNVKAEPDHFSLLGSSWGDIDPESPKQVERRWRRTYSYGEPEVLSTQFVWPEEPAQNSGGSAWTPAGVVLSLDSSLLHVAPDGSTLARIDGVTGAFIKDAAEDRSLWRRTKQATTNETGEVDVLSELQLNPTFELHELWRDNHCSRRWLQTAGFVAGGEQIVLFAKETGESTAGTMFVHRIQRETGEVVDTFEFSQDGDSFFAGSVFETEDGDIGVLFYGGDEVDGAFRATARAFFPFE